MLVGWADMGLVLVDQFRDGNVPALMETLAVARRAFAALPSTVNEHYFWGDSACHESDLVNWLRNEQREGGPCMRIGFAIGARMSEALHTAMPAVPEAAWEAYSEPSAEETREGAEAPSVPGEKAEKKDTQPLRYVVIRIRKHRGELFEDGSQVRHFVVLSNLANSKATLRFIFLLKVKSKLSRVLSESRNWACLRRRSSMRSARRVNSSATR
jgi:hypothetical protein